MILENSKQRSFYWDNIKGILMFLVVFAHVLYQTGTGSAAVSGTVKYIYMFHMPAFAFVSGFFGKSEKSSSAFSIVRLIFLYFIFNSVMGFMFGFGSMLEPLYSYWYLIALAVWRLTAKYIAKFRDITLILIAIAVFTGFFMSINNFFSAARIICFYPYYMAGCLLPEEKSAATAAEKFSKRFGKGIAALTLCAAAAFAADLLFNYDQNALLMHGYDYPSDAFGRIALFGIAFLAIYALRNIVPDREIPFLSMIGRNSLCIYLFHRPFTLWINMLAENIGTVLLFAAAVLCTIVLCLIFGNNIAAKYLNAFADAGANIFVGEKDNVNKKAGAPLMARLAALLVSAGFIAIVISDAYEGFNISDLEEAFSGQNGDESTGLYENSGDIIYPAMTAAQKESFDNAFRITFAGDLILLEDQVKRAYTDDGYDFSPMFEYAEKYISSADYAIGVFEGPMAGESAGYSTSNFDDGKELYLNFPDEFAEAVKNAGFDLVTTANNHVLDKGEAGALRTLDVLDSIGLDHTGSYRSQEEKQTERVKLVECEGIRMAVLSYTYGANYYDNSELAYPGGVSYLTSLISGTSGELFEQLKADVEKDFEEAKKLSPDLIIVLPHIGTQFSNVPDEEQETWSGIFKELGADIILGDHPHAVEPAIIENYGGKNVFTAYCPGNFANIYREDQGDTSMLTEVYIDRNTKQIIGGSIVPLYTQSAIGGNFRALPIYDIVNSPVLRAQLSTDDFERAQNANDIITDVLFGNSMDIDSMTERYYFDENGFIRVKTTGLALTEQMKNGTLYKAIEKADNICFIGDSVTEGTKNGGCPWYEPIEEFFPEKHFLNYSKGGCTVSYMNENAAEIPSTELYVIALGTNDVRYRDESTCAMTAEGYTERMESLAERLRKNSPLAEFIFIAPWYSTDGDPFCTLSFEEKTALNDEYSDALEELCGKKGFGYINANTYIKDMLSKYPDELFLLDHIHPNGGRGVIMYSEAALLS